MATKTDLENAIAAQKTAVAAKLQTLADQVAALQAQIDSGSLLTSADLDALVTAVQGISA